MLRHLSLFSVLLIALNSMLLVFTLTISALELARFQQLKVQDEESTYRLVIEELDHSIEASIRRHGVMPSATAMQIALQRRRASNPSIQRLSIFVPGERIIADTDQRMIGTIAPESWQVPPDRADTLVRPDASPAYYALVRNVGKETQRPACVVLLVTQQNESRLAHYLVATISEKAVWCLVSGSLLLLLVSGLLSRRWLASSRREHQRIAAEVHGLSTPDRSATGVEPTPGAAEPMRLSQDIGRTLRDLDRASKALDELAAR